jgi:hypothetical protein
LPVTEQGEEEKFTHPAIIANFCHNAVATARASAQQQSVILLPSSSYIAAAPSFFLYASVEVTHSSAATATTHRAHKKLINKKEISAIDRS